MSDCHSPPPPPPTATAMASRRPPSDVSLSEAISQFDLQTTLCLQRIDAHFAAAHETIQDKVLPKVVRYGSHSL